MAPGTKADQALVHVQPDAVPALRAAYFSALCRVDRQIELAENDLRLAAWAKDPISTDAAEVFNNRAVTPGAGSALDMLRAYRTQLTSAVDTLDAVATQYQQIEQDNSVTVGRHPDDGGV